jgi:hypothetical protein
MAAPTKEMNEIATRFANYSRPWMCVPGREVCPALGDSLRPCYTTKFTRLNKFLMFVAEI